MTVTCEVLQYAQIFCEFLIGNLAFDSASKEKKNTPPRTAGARKQVILQKSKRKRRRK